MSSSPLLEERTWTIDGHRRAFVTGGSGPAVLLLHGIGCDHTTWDATLDLLVADHTVISPDFLGHGHSDNPRADYSVGAFADRLRELLGLLDIETVTVVGHSFGGGVALQFALQYPQVTERLVLVDPGGLGTEVHPMLRAMTLPGAETALGVWTFPPLLAATKLAAGVVHHYKLPGSVDLPFALSVLGSIAEPTRRSAFLHILRSVIDWRGQQVSVLDQLRMLSRTPILLVWGERDSVLPARQGAELARNLPTVQLHTVPGAGHFPHIDEPAEFSRLLTGFLATPGVRLTEQEWRDLLDEGVDRDDEGVDRDDVADRAEVARRGDTTDPA